MTRRQALAALGMSAVGATVNPAPYRHSLSDTTLRKAANQCGINVGAYASMTDLQTPDLSSFILSNFNLISAGNEFKWNYLRPTPDAYDFSRADWIIEF